MRKVLRFFLWAVAFVVVLGGAAFWYLIDAPDPEVPHLSGRFTEGVIESGGLKRSYLAYVPAGLAKGAPLVIAMHGSDGDSGRMRIATGYGFERLADAHGFAVVYPNGFEGYWNACNIVGDYAANKRNIDDVGFLTALIDKLAGEIGVDVERVFATGISRGGQMAYRLALEAPSRFRAVAAVAASVPELTNFKCMSAGERTSSVMIMNGTEDPLNPFEGGEVKLFGLYARGMVKSSRASAQYFADLNHITGEPTRSETQVPDGFSIERVLWRDASPVEVELVAIHGGGHVLPQPYWRAPRLQGPTPREPDGSAVIWEFFAHQRPR